jgi:hypothetical protein
MAVLSVDIAELLPLFPVPAVPLDEAAPPAPIVTVYIAPDDKLIDVLITPPAPPPPAPSL